VLEEKCERCDCDRAPYGEDGQKQILSSKVRMQDPKDFHFQEVMEDFYHDSERYQLKGEIQQRICKGIVEVVLRRAEGC